jgi:RNA polymerase sigma factor (sigma-70 family)
MAAATLNTFLQRLRRLLGGAAVEGVTDGQLLARFLRERDEVAFTTLVQRHGPMVWALCRRLVRNEADAEDAFQATFLILARKADSIRKKNSVAGWLYGVAARVASRARAVAGRLRLQPADVLDTAEARPEPGADMRDLQALLQDELCRLPESDRAVLVLCYLEGKTHRQAASELGWARGSVARRLKAARARLRAGLARRGLALPAGALAAALARGSASAGEVPALSLQAAVRVAMEVAAGRSVGELLSAHAHALAEGEMRMFWWTRTKAVAAACLAVALIGTGGGFLLRPSGGDGQPEARGQEGAPLGAKPKGAREPETLRNIPLNAKELLEAVRFADTVFIGRIRTADLSEGWWSGWAMCLRSVTYEVNATLKGAPRKEQTVEFIILTNWRGDYAESDSPRLRRSHFDRGMKHLVCSGSNGKQQVVLFWTPSVQQAVACINKSGKPEASVR